MRGRPFERGKPRPARAGRRKGTPNRVTRAVKDFISAVVDDGEVQAAVRRRLIKGDVSGFLGLVAQAHGRPSQALDITVKPPPMIILPPGTDKPDIE